MANSNSWQTINVSDFLKDLFCLFSCLMSVQTDLLVPWCDFMKATWMAM